ncbi:sensor histidine kinase [Tenacibaculum sp. nBUS_03]|uniref:sensor histidine kinase n=1 Tax=Tenacibaculum sp. nBUS_03 TaxID=3395320 RepID=UPI003EBD962A
MNKKKIYIHAICYAAALLILLIIQINWIWKTAEIKEALFNKKASMVLSKTADLLSEKKELCSSINECIGDKEVYTIDSLIQTNMKLYGFLLEYSFGVSNKKGNKYFKGDIKKTNSFNTVVKNENLLHDLDLVLYLPKKQEFIIKEIGGLFFISIIMILIVIFLFWKTTYSLIKEKRILKETKELFNNMAHEFNTPITNINLAAKILQRKEANHLGKNLTHYSQIILNENKKLKDHVQKGLRLTELDLCETAITKQEFDLHQVIDKAVKAMKIQIDNKNGKINLLLRAEKMMLRADKSHLFNILCNLIDNALKYSRKKPEILIQTINTENSIKVSITDNGIGIKKEFHQKIFNRFFRVNDDIKVKGFGIGLAYVKKTIDLHKGNLLLESIENKGTKLTITLPLNE